MKQEQIEHIARRRNEDNLIFFWNCIDQGEIETSIFWLVTNYVENSAELWNFLKTKVSENSDLYSFCSIHAEGVITDTVFWKVHYQQQKKQLLENSIPMPQQDLSQKNIEHLLSTNNIQTLLPIIWYNDKLGEKHMESYRFDSLMNWVLAELHRYKQNQNYFELYCGMYLWKKTYGRIDPTLNTVLGRWSIMFGPKEALPKSTMGLWPELLCNEELISLADTLRVQTYDIEGIAFAEELEEHLIERNRSGLPSTRFDILPILDLEDEEQVDLRMQIMLDYIEKNPEDLWASATLLLDASVSNSIDIKFEERIQNCKHRLWQVFHKDPLVHAFAFEKREHSLLQLPPSALKFTELCRLNPENKQYHDSYHFWVGSPPTEGIPNYFDIQYRKRTYQHRHEEKEQWGLAIILTIPLFLISLWILSYILQSIW